MVGITAVGVPRFSEGNFTAKSPAMVAVGPAFNVTTSLGAQMMMPRPPVAVQARRKKQIFLQNWVTKLHDFLNLNERAILPDAGKVSREEAHRLAEEEYERFAARRREALEAQGEADLLGLLDTEVKKLPRKPKPPNP